MDDEGWSSLKKSRKESKKSKKRGIYREESMLEPTDDSTPRSDGEYVSSAETSTHGNAKKQFTETKNTFPIPAQEQGSQIIDVHVGSGRTGQIFRIHRALLCSASPYYSRLLQGNFSESQQDEMLLKNECSMAFEVLYQYLYSGQVLKAKFFTQSRIPDDVLWLRTYKLSHHTQIDSLLHESYSNIRQILHDEGRIVPSLTFISELYDDDICQEELRLYVVAHTAYWIHNNSKGDWREWEALMNHKPAFGLAVAIQLAKIHSSVYDGCREHPSQDDAFDQEILLAVFDEKIAEPLERTNGITAASQDLVED